MMFSFSLYPNTSSFEISTSKTDIRFDILGQQNNIVIDSGPDSAIFHNVIQGGDMTVKFEENSIEIQTILSKQSSSPSIYLSISSQQSVIISKSDIITATTPEYGTLFSMVGCDVTSSDEKVLGPVLLDVTGNSVITLKLPTSISEDQYPISLSARIDFPPDQQQFEHMAQIQSIDPSSRPIYKPTPGTPRFSIYFFQAIVNGVVDYPFNTFNGVPITSTVPQSPNINPGDQNTTDSFFSGKGLDSLTIYIEFVCNTIIASSIVVPSLVYDVIPPNDNALHSYNNSANYVGNINGCSVYRGAFTIHSQRSPLYVDGLYKIRTHVINHKTYDLVLKIPMVYSKFGYFTVGVSRVGGNDTIA